MGQRGHWRLLLAGQGKRERRREGIHTGLLFSSLVLNVLGREKKERE
jgi:hypothetical protein